MKKIKFDLIIYPLLILLSIVLIFVMLYNDCQAITPMLLNVTFQGEYKADNGSWQPVIKGQKVICNEDEIHLRGFFQLEFPDGEVIGKVPKDTHVTAYFDHIGGQININGQQFHDFDMENRQFGNSSCGENWVKFDYPADENDTMEIILRNPHKYGNSDAFDTFLESMCTNAGAIFDEQKIQEGTAERTAGIVIIIVSFIILGVAIFSTVLKVPHSKMLWIFAFMILSAGGYFVIDSPNFCLCGNTTIFNTTVKQLCIILYPMFLFAFAENCLKDKPKIIGGAVTKIYGISSVIVVIIATTGKILLYDLNYYLIMIQLAAALILIVLCALCFKGSNAKQNVMRAVCILSLLALAADISAVLFGIYNTAVISKAVFVAVFISALFYSLRLIPMNIKASIHAKELQLELQENKVAIMLNQIQPHFLYNALSAICDLCGSEPLKAREALVDFSVYLRENMDFIKSIEPVSFERELSHIKTYMKLEKLRFGDKVNVVYCIGTEDFMIQPLTVQPIVENAVKHGICMKENGGTVTLQTSEENGIVTITVIDDGVGFDLNSSETAKNSRSHVGLENVKSRVENFADGKFTVESEIGKGTVVTISFRE